MKLFAYAKWKLTVCANFQWLTELCVVNWLSSSSSAPVESSLGDKDLFVAHSSILSGHDFRGYFTQIPEVFPGRG